MPSGSEAFVGRTESPVILPNRPKPPALHALENQSRAGKDYQTFIVAFALLALLTAFGLCFYCYQRYRHGQDSSQDIPKMPVRHGLVVHNPNGELSIACIPGAQPAPHQI